MYQILSKLKAHLHISHKYLLLPFKKVTEKLFDDYCIYIFDPGAKRISKL